jgi:glutathione S-transferase
MSSPLVALKDGAQYMPDYVAINPKSKVPALDRGDGRVLTEWPVIAAWLAKANPEAKLMPTDLEGETRCAELTDFILRHHPSPGLHPPVPPRQLHDAGGGPPEGRRAGQGQRREVFRHAGEDLARRRVPAADGLFGGRRRAVLRGILGDAPQRA